MRVITSRFQNSVKSPKGACKYSMKLASSNRSSVTPNSQGSNVRGGWSGPDPSLSTAFQFVLVQSRRTISQPILNAGYVVSNEENAIL